MSFIVSQKVFLSDRRMSSIYTGGWIKNPCNNLEGFPFVTAINDRLKLSLSLLYYYLYYLRCFWGPTDPPPYTIIFSKKVF